MVHGESEEGSPQCRAGPVPLWSTHQEERPDSDYVRLDEPCQLEVRGRQTTLPSSLRSDLESSDRRMGAEDIPFGLCQAWAEALLEWLQSPGGYEWLAERTMLHTKANQLIAM